MAWLAIVIVALVACSSALAESLDAEVARRFVVNKLFAFTCFEGSRGAGRIYGDGSVIAARDRSARYGCQRERSRSKVIRSALQSTAFHLSLALSSLEQMIKVSVAQSWACISPIATFPTA